MSNHDYQVGDRVRYIVPDNENHTVRFGALATVIPRESRYGGPDAIWLELDDLDTSGRRRVWTESRFIEPHRDFSHVTEEEQENLATLIKELIDA